MKYLVVLLGSFLFIAFELNFVETCGGYLPILKQRPKLKVYYEQQTRNSRCPTKDGKFVQCTKESIVPKTREILEPYWKTEFGCCTNYEETNPGICKPICQNCGNGTCISPDVCICNPGFNKEENKCVSIYESVCVLAECDSATECKCPEGYKSHNGSREQCEPICINQCENGFCSAPETCTCNEGYKRNPENNHCDPVCEEKCINAVCTSPNICICIEGYSMRTFSISECSTRCEIECTNGKCDDSGVCVCNAGFENKPDSFYQCVPKCNKECINGNCTYLGLCKCNIGYDFKPGSEYICEELLKSTKPWIGSSNEIIGTTTISYNINEHVHRHTTLHGMNENIEMVNETNGDSYFRWAMNDTHIKETTENSYNAEENEVTDITANEVVERSTTFLNTNIWADYDYYGISDSDEVERNEDSYLTSVTSETTDTTYNSNDVIQNLRFSSGEDNTSDILESSEEEITKIIANIYNSEEGNQTSSSSFDIKNNSEIFYGRQTDEIGTTVIYNVTTESSGIAVYTDVAVVNDEQLTETNYNNYSSRETISNSTISSAESTTKPRGVSDNPNTGTAKNNHNVNTTSKYKFICNFGICVWLS